MSSSSAKRRIGGHFGSAVGASSKRQRADWRDEVDEPEDAPPEAAQDDASDSDALLDPGTPLPSDDEDVAGVEANASANVILTEGPTADLQAAAASGHEDSLANEAMPRPPLIVTFDLMIGEAPRGSMQVVLPNGMDADLERRLALCTAPGGSAIEAVLSGSRCLFAGHPVPEAARPAVDPLGPSEPAKEVQLSLPPTALGPLGRATGAHSCEGLLTSPVAGPGLVLTLGPQPELDATHVVLGRVLAGRKAMRRLQALAPCTGGPEPRLQPTGLYAGLVQPSGQSSATAVAAARGEKTSEETLDGSERLRPQLRLEPAIAADKDSEVFFWDDEPSSGALPPAEVLELAELEINSRDLEIVDLKQQTFSRERQQCVAALEASLESVAARLDALQGLDETLEGQRSWDQERARHLLRQVKKLQ